MDGLAALVRESLGSDPFSGVVYVFRSKRADRLKLLLWDGSGLVLLAKRLEQGSFRWPTVGDGVMRLSASQLSALLDGLDWTRVRAVRVRTPRAASTSCCPSPTSSRKPQNWLRPDNNAYNPMHE